MQSIPSLFFVKVCLIMAVLFQEGNTAWPQEIEDVVDLQRLESHVLCQGQRKNLTCKDSSLVMVIMSAFYGRKVVGTVLCPYSSTIKGAVGKDDKSDAALKCGEHDVAENVAKRCNKKYKCVLKVDKNLFGNYCPEVYKYLNIIYRCVNKEYVTPTTVITASPRSTLSSPKVTAPSPTSTTRKKRRRRSTSHPAMYSTKAPKTTVLTSIMPVTTTPKQTTKPTTKRPPTTRKKRKKSTTPVTVKQETTTDYDTTTYSLPISKTLTSEKRSELSTTKPTKHDPSTGTPVFAKTNQTTNDTVEPTKTWNQTTSTTTITTTFGSLGGILSTHAPSTPTLIPSREVTTTQGPVLMPQDSQEVSWENSSTYLTIFLVSIFSAALIMALGTFLVIRYRKRKKPPKLNILHKPKRYVDLPPKPKPNHSMHHNGHIPGRKPRKKGMDREDGGAPTKFSEPIFTAEDVNNKTAKQLANDNYPGNEYEASKNGDEPTLHINPMFTKNGKIPHSNDVTSATNRTDGNMNVIQENHQLFQGNAFDASRNCANTKSEEGETRSCSAGNVSHGYTSNFSTSSQLKRRPSVGGIPHSTAGSRDGLYRYQSTGSVPLQRSAPVSSGNKSPRQQDPSMRTKRQVNGVETVSRQVVTTPASYGGTIVHHIHMPLPGQTAQGQLYSSSPHRGGTVTNQPTYAVGSTSTQPYNEKAQSAHRPYDPHSIPSITLNTEIASRQSSLTSRKGPGGESKRAEQNLPNIVSNPEYDARASPIWRKTYGSPGTARTEKLVSSAGANSYGRAGRGLEQTPSSLVTGTNPSQTGDQGTRLTASSELVSPLDSMPVENGTNTSRLKISDRHTSLSYGQGGHSFHPPPPPSHDTVCDSSDDDLYSIIAKGKHYSCAVADPNLSVSQHSSTALPRHDEIKYVAVRVPRKV